MTAQVRFRPAHFLPTLPDDRVGALRVRLSPFMSQCVVLASTAELLRQAREKIGPLQTPFPTQAGQHLRRFAVATARFHPASEREAILGRIRLNPVRAQQPFHARHPIGQRRLGKAVKVLSHQARGVSLPAGLFASLAQGAEERLAILVIKEARFTPIR